MTTSPATRNGSMASSVLLVLGSCISLQFGASFATKLFDDLGPMGVTTLRLGIAGVVLLAVTRPKVRQWSREQWVAVVLFGLTLAGMNGMFYEAISRIPIGPAVAIEFLGPLGLAAVLSRKLKDYAWIVLALIGVGILGFEKGGGGLDPAGVAFVLGAGFFWALYILASERVGRVLDGAGGLAVALLVGTVALLPMGAPGAVKGFASVHNFSLALGTALLASLVPYGLELRALRMLPRAVFGVLLALEPVVAALSGWLILHQGLGRWRAIAAIVVVIAGAGSALTSSGHEEQAGVAPDDDAPDAVAASVHP